MGHHSNQIEKLLGYVAKSEVIHKDDMVVWDLQIYWVFIIGLKE